MKILLHLIIVIFLFISCGEERLELLNNIRKAEDDLLKCSSDSDQYLIDALSNFYLKFPKDAQAPNCLAKLHMMYLGVDDFETAVMYGDLILKNYKGYINREIILESLANIYDMNILPRDTAKVRFYNEILLRENLNLPLEKVEDIKNRLDNLNLTLTQLIEKYNL